MKTKMVKDVKVNENVWFMLNKLKLKEKLKSMNEVIKFLFDKYKASGKKKDTK